MGSLVYFDVDPYRVCRHRPHPSTQICFTRCFGFRILRQLLRSGVYCNVLHCALLPKSPLPCLSITLNFIFFVFMSFQGYVATSKLCVAHIFIKREDILFMFVLRGDYATLIIRNQSSWPDITHLKSFRVTDTNQPSQYLYPLRSCRHGHPSSIIKPTKLRHLFYPNLIVEVFLERRCGTSKTNKKLMITKPLRAS